MTTTRAIMTATLLGASAILLGCATAPPPAPAPVIASRPIDAPPSAPPHPPTATCPGHHPAQLVLRLPDEPPYGTACDLLDHATCVQLCNGGITTACIEAGNALSRDGVDDAGQLALYGHACELGDAGGCTNLGATLRLASPPRAASFECATPLFIAACHAREPNGCAMLGHAYVGREAIAFDLAAARAAFRAGCDPSILDVDPTAGASIQFACQAWTQAIDAGELGPRDGAALRESLERGCRVGDPEACAMLQHAP